MMGSRGSRIVCVSVCASLNPGTFSGCNFFVLLREYLLDSTLPHDSSVTLGKLLAH